MNKPYNFEKFYIQTDKNVRFMTKAVIYIRVSSKEQEETGYSLDAQRKFLEAYAHKNGIRIERLFSASESASGKKDRENFSAMLAFIEKEDIKVIICEKSDRLSRNMKEAVDVSRWLEKGEDRAIHLAKEKEIFTKNSSSHQKFIWNIRLSVAQFYTDNLSEEVKKGQMEKIAQGWLPTKPPLGYRTTGDRGHKIHVVDTDKAPAIKRMFELYATGEYSIKHLIEETYALGLRTNAGGKIVKSRIDQLLRDPFYYGKMSWKGIVYPGKQEALISEALFTQVQKILKGRGAPRYTKHNPLFKALLKCAGCNGTVTWETKKGHWYGHCNGYRDCPNKKPGTSKYVRQESIEKQLLPYFDKIGLQNERLVEWLQKALKASHEAKKAFKEASKKQLDAQYDRAERHLEKLYDDRIDGAIPQDLYKRKLEQYTKIKEDALDALKRFENVDKKYYEIGSDIIELAHRAKEICFDEERPVEDRRIVMRVLFSNLILDKDKVAVSLSDAFAVLAKHAPTVNKNFEQAEKPANKRESGDSGANFAALLRR